MRRQWKPRTAVRLRPFERETDRNTAHALRNALASYWFGRRPYKNTTVLWYFGKAFARLTGNRWIVFGHVPECIIDRATSALGELDGMPPHHARRKILNFILQLREMQSALAA